MITQAVTLQHDATIGRELRYIGIALTVATTALGFYRLHNTLEPVFRANGIRWSPLPPSMGEVTWLLAMATFFATFLYNLVFGVPAV